ncbi:MAG: S9 family peptidase [Gammaproteobacteria bacterium]|nr:S9 family peptidase [Gammaproteobacteria bacterium]
MKKILILVLIIFSFGNVFSDQSMVAKSSKYSRHVDYPFVKMSSDGKQLLTHLLTDGYYQLLLIDTETYKTELVKFWGDIMDAEFYNQDKIIVSAIDTSQRAQVYIVDQNREIKQVESLKGISKTAISRISIFPEGAFERDEIRVAFELYDGSTTYYNLDSPTLKVNSEFNLPHPDDYEVIGSNKNLSIRELWEGINYKIVLTKNDKDIILHQGEYISEDHLSVLGFTDKGNLLVKRSDGDKSSLSEYSVNPFKKVKELWSSDRYDFDGDRIYLANHKSIPAFVVDKDKPNVLYIDKQLKNIMSKVNNALKNKTNFPVAADKNFEKIVILSISETHPGEYFIYEPSKKTLAPLLSRAEWISSSEGLAIKEIAYKSTDDLQITGYLTEPKNKKNAPLIVLPHGGPTARDYARYNPMVQYFASLGYAVLQPAYRGSTGYGAKHFESGLKQIGLKMQDDLYEGVKFANSKGYGLENRVCFIGASFGAYMSIKAVADRPEKFKCAVAIAGFYDVIALLEADKEKEFYPIMEEIYGSIPEDKQYLQEVSVTNLVEKIQGEVFIIHGIQDRRIDTEQAFDFIRLLEQSNKNYLSLILEDEGHSISKSINRRRLYLGIGEFLEYVLPVDSSNKDTVKNKRQYFSLRNKQAKKAMERYYKKYDKSPRVCEKETGSHIRKCE